MQNKPNFQKAEMNLNLYSTMNYENKPRLLTPEKQTQSNPISKGTFGNIWYKKCNVLRIFGKVLQHFATFPFIPESPLTLVKLQGTYFFAKTRIFVEKAG